MKIIDLRSDTVTLPSEEMRKAMHAAELGDDVYGEDPTVNRLEEMSAALLGKEAGLFVTSGTMGNVTALLTHCGRGAQAIAGDLSHIILHEAGAAGVFGGIVLRNIPNTHEGHIDLVQLADVMDGEDDIHKTKTEVICIENTFHGQALDPGYLLQVKQFATKHNTKLHLDGARIFNASVGLNTTPSAITAPFDSVQFCFSKGLAAPVGSMLVGSKDFIARARRIRKMLGGGWRQAGVLAAACIVSLEKMIDRLHEDHANAAVLRHLLESIEGIRVMSAVNPTNMVFFMVNGGNAEQAAFCERLAKQGVLMFSEAGLGIRAVTHYGLDEKDIREAAKIIADQVSSLAHAAR